MTSPERAGATVIPMTGSLDADTAPFATQRLHQLIEQGQNRLVVDLSGLRYMASAGLRTLISASRLARIGGGAIHLAGPQGIVATVIEQSGFGDVIPTYPSVDDATAAFCETG